MPPELRTKRNVDDVIFELETERSCNILNFDSNQNIYLNEAVKRGYVFTESESMQISREIYMEKNNSLLTFIAEACVPEGRIKRSEFRQLYLAWCKAEGMYPESPRNIDPMLQENFKIVPTKRNGHYYYPLDVDPEIREAFKI